jgi:hypothetical protein
MIRPADVVVVCGSRDWGIPERILHRLGQLPQGTLIRHGGASKRNPDTGEEMSADALAETIARGLALETSVFRPNYARFGIGAPFRRNEAMLDADPRPSVVIAFQRDDSRGTQHTIDQARRRGIDVEVHVP